MNLANTNRKQILRTKWEVPDYASSCTNAIGDRADFSHRER